MRVFEELKQRKVLKTAALYFAVAWGVTEVLSYLIERIPVFPAWADTAIAILFVMGFPVAVFLAWMFDVGRDGVRRADPSSSLGKGVIALSLVGLLVSTAMLSYLLIPAIEAEKGLLHQGDRDTVAVLPFENLTGDPSLGFLGAGLAEDIRQRLLAQTKLKVIGRVSMASFSGSDNDLSSLRNLLDAGLVLEGSLQSNAGQMNVSVALLDTVNGQQIWGNTFSAERIEWDALRQRIVTSLAEQLALTVRVQQGEEPVQSDALAAYLRGLAELGRPEVADGWFDEAVRLAPDFADAWARRALLRVDMIWRNMPREQAWIEAETFLASARAIEADNLLADIAEASLQGEAILNPAASYEILQRIEGRAPNHPLVLGGLSTALCYLPGRLEEAEIYARRYVAQDPLNADAHNRLSLALMFANKDKEAMIENQRALDLDPRFMRAWDYRTNWQFFTGQVAEALATATRRMEIEVTVSQETRACMLYMVGELLPLERAELMLRQGIEAGIGIPGGQGWWCWGSVETLVTKLVRSGRLDDAQKLITQFEDQQIWNWPGSEVFARMYLAESNGQQQLEILRKLAGDEPVEAMMGPEPPLQYFNFWIAQGVARAMINAGRIDDGRRLAASLASSALAYAGPEGMPTVSSVVVDALAMAGDSESALNYAERIGPERFMLFGSAFLTTQGNIPELAGKPRWQGFLDRCRSRWMEEIDKFDRMVASGEIFLPFPVPRSASRVDPIGVSFHNLVPQNAVVPAN